MDFRFLGSSGLKLSAVSYGNWVTHTINAKDAAEACIHAAIDAGITTFDTADVYANGVAESILGETLQAERREGLEILTKVFAPTGPGGHNDSGLSRKHIHESINASLRRLRTDYVDLYQAHRYDYSTPLEETMEAFADLVHQGKALYIGASEWSPRQLRAGHALARELRIPFVAHQTKYNALYRVIEAETVPVSAELGIGQICFSPIEQGLLSGKYTPGASLPSASRARAPEGSEYLKDFLTKETLERVARLRPVADQAGLTMAQLAVAWVLQNSNVATAITGGSRPEQVAENAAAAGHRLGEDIMVAIDDALDPIIERNPDLAGSMSPIERPS